MAKQKETKSIDELLQEAIIWDKKTPYEIPENWVWTRFDALCFNENIEVKIQSKDYLDKGNYAIIDQGQALIGGFTNDETALYKGKLPIVIFGDHTRNIKYIDFPFAQGADGIKVLSFSKLLNVKFYYYYFKSLNMPNLGYRRHYSILKEELIVFPPFAEQERMVKRIESLFDKLDQAKELIQESLDSYEERKTKILHQAFSGELTKQWRKKNFISKNFEIKKFEEVANIKSNLVDPKDFQNMPHIAPDNIEKFTGRLLEYKTIKEDAVISGKHTFFKGQILYSKIRPNLSKIIIAPFDGLCSADMYPIEAKENAKYLWYFMLSSNFLQQASTAGSRTVLPKINQKELSKLKIMIPPNPEQEEIVRILDDIFEKEDKSKALLDCIENIEAMKKTILAKAFRGQLGTNDPADEPAIVLLKRILEEKISNEVKNEN